MTRAYRRPAPLIPGTQEAAAERDAAVAIANRRLQGRHSRKAGEVAEAIVGNRLRSLGLKCVQRIEVGWKVVRHPTTRSIIGAHPIAKVLADWHGLAPGGRSVICEVKRRTQPMKFSDLEAHQVIALNAHFDAGGISLLALVHGAGIAIMAWPVLGFGPGTSLNALQADALDIKAIP